ncbi:MAG: transglycosylase SLT domain-containing protein [Chloroflexota bacterium]
MILIQRLRFLNFGVIAVILILCLFAYPFTANLAMRYLQPRPMGNGDIAPLFTDQIQYWERDIMRWSTAYQIDPNLMATIMQIESCGHPTVASPAGAQGLFQVMPFHFASGENMVDPHMNAYRSANFIRECTGYANGDVGLTLACYNGGPSVTWRNFDTWAHETQRYYVWGVGIYQDASAYQENSDTLNEWLRAGGQNLCNRASMALSLRLP